MSFSKHFSSLNLYKSYHQIKIVVQKIPKTAMVTPLGSYCFCKMPMGLCNAGASFEVLLMKFYEDFPLHLCILTTSWFFSRHGEEHMRHLNLVFERLKYYSLILLKNKCSFEADEIVFLGHKVNQGDRHTKPFQAQQYETVK